MKKKKINILIQKNKKLKLLKNEYLLKICKSFIRCNNVNNLKKNYISMILNKFYKNVKKQETKIKKTCIVTGKRRGMLSMFNTSRNVIRNFMIYNKIDNLKNHDW